MIKGIIFDCDGVLLDSEPLFYEAARNQLKTYGITLPAERPDGSTGISEETFCQMILDMYPQIGRDLESFCAEYFEYVKAVLMSDDLLPMKGVVDFVRRQHERGITMAVATSSPASHAAHKLKLFGIEDCFACIVSSDDITHSKPHPEIYLKAIEKIAIPVSELIAIEDAPNGIRSAKDAGLFTVGFKGSVMVQDTSLANLEASDFTEIDKYICRENNYE